MFEQPLKDFCVENNQDYETNRYTSPCIDPYEADTCYKIKVSLDVVSFLSTSIGSEFGQDLEFTDRRGYIQINESTLLGAPEAYGNSTNLLHKLKIKNNKF